MHVCQDCSRLPRQTRFRIEALDEIWGFLEQTNMSAKNIARLALLAQSDDDEVREIASIALAIGKAQPGRRGRYHAIKAEQPELWQRMLKKGMVQARGQLARSDVDVEATLAVAEGGDEAHEDIDEDLPYRQAKGGQEGHDADESQRVLP